MKSGLFILQNEVMADEIAGRVLNDLGYKRATHNVYEEGDIGDQLNRLVASFTNEKLREVVLDWSKTAPFAPWVVRSNADFARYAVRKIPPPEKFTVDAEHSHFFGSQQDNYMIAALLKPEEGQAEVQDDGSLTVRSDEIVTTGGLLFSPGGIALHDKVYKPKGIPTELACYLHEFGHFLQYAIASHPIVVLAQLYQVDTNRRIESS